MSDDSDIEDLNVCRKGKRKICVVNDSNSDSDDSQITNNNRRRRLPRVESESESQSDSSLVHKRSKNKKMRVVSSESSDDAEENGDSNSSTDNDSGASSYEETDEEDTQDVAAASTTQTQSNKNGNWSDSSDGQSEKCPICLLTFKTQDIGSPETCDHTFCVECIQEWSKNVNTCPVDRQEFTLILVRRELNGRVVRRIPVIPKQATDELMIGGDGNGVADLTYCEICGQSDREDRMLLCDGCDLGYHMECLDPPLLSIPVDEWYCSDCSRDNSGPLADAVEIYDGELDALITEMEEIGGGRLPPRRPPRLLPRTRQSERVRANIETQRHQQNLHTPGPSSSSLLDNQPSTSSGFDDLSPATSSRRNLTTTVSTSRKKPKKRKRRKGRRRTGGVIEYEIDEESGVKFALKAKKKRRRRKKKRLRRTVSAVPKTVKRRLANQLGIYRNSGCLKPKQVVKNVLGLQRSQAGIATVDLFGNRNELEYFSDSDNNEDGGADISLGGSAGSSILARARPATAISLRPQHRHKLKTLSFPSPPAATTPCDILGSILDQQTKFLSKNAKLSVGENGKILIDAETNSKLPTEQKVDVQSSSSNSTTQVPMYPGYGNSGNRSSYGGSSSFNSNRGGNSYNRGSGGGGGGSSYGGNNYGNNSFRGRGGGTSGYSGNNQYDSRGDNNRYMDFLHRGSPSYQQSPRGPPFQRGRGAPRFPSTRRSNDNNFQRHSYPFDQHSQQELDLSSSGSNVQEHEISRSSETQCQPPPDTSNHPQDHTSSMMSTTTTSSYEDDANNDDLDIYSDIETKDTGTSSPSNEVVGSSAPTLVPPPLPPSLPGIVYGSDSDVNDSDTELVIDDTDKQDDGYDPAEPSAETDSEPDISTSSTTGPPPSQSAESEQIVASTSGEDEGKIIGPQLPEEMRKLLINEETQQSLPPVNVVQPRIVHLQPKSVNEVGEDEEDSGDDDRCPNMSIYSSQNFVNYDEDVGIGGGEAILPSEEKEKKDDNDDNCPNFSIYSAESMGVAKVTDDDDLVIPTTASVEAESSGDKPAESRDDEPDSVQNDEVESSTTDFEKDSISSLPLPPGPAPPPAVVATTVDEEKQEEPDSGVQNAEPDSNNMEKCEPELTDSENENQSEEISTTTTQKVEESSSTPAKKLPVKIDANMKKDLDRKPTSSSMRILQLYDDSDFEEWSEGGVPPSGVSAAKDAPPKDAADNNVMAEIEKMTEAVSEEEERCYTPCMDEKKDGKDGNDRNESLGIGGLDTEMVSEDEKNDFDESHEIKTASDGEALEINAKDHELDLAARPEDYEEGEIVEGAANAAAKAAKCDPKPAATETTQEQIILTDDNDEAAPGGGPSPTVKDKKKKSALSSAVSSSFKKVSKNTKERNYRDKENRDRSKSKDKKSTKDRSAGIGDKKLKNKKKEKKKELERYDVRNIIGQRAKKDMFGRDETRHRSQSPLGASNDNRQHRSRKENSWDRSSSRSFTPPLSRNRRRTTVTPPPRRRKSSSRSLSPRARRSVTPNVRAARRRSFSRRRSISQRRRSLSNHRRSLTPPPTRRRSSGRSRSYSPRRNKRSLSRSRSYSPYRPRSTRRSRSPIHAKNRRKSRSRSRSIAPANKNRYRKQHNTAKPKTTVKNKAKKNKKKKSVSPDDHRSRLSLSATPPIHRNIENPSVTQTQTEWVSGGGARYRRDWTPSWSRSPSSHQRIQRSNVQNISTWTPPLHYNDAAATALPSSPKLTVYLRNNEAIRKKKDKKKKTGEKRNKDVTGKSKRRRLEQRQRTPPPSKEVFASGDNILVSVSFNKVNENDGNGVTNVRDVISSSGKRKRGDLDGDNANKKKKTNKDKTKKSGDKSKKKKKDTSNIKPVAIIDLDQSPFKELVPSPRDVIVLSDSDNGEKEAELMERQEMLREELLEMGSQEENNSVPQSPTENNYTGGPKTPPEPQIKFLIQKPTQLIRNVQNPLHDDQDDEDDDAGPEEDMIDPQEELELRLNEVMHKGPNTPPEPPSSPPSSPDVYDPFEPTKSRSPSPTEPPAASGSVDPISTKATPPDIAESESSLVDLAVGPLEKPSTNVSGGATDPSPMQRVLSILNPKQVTTPECSPPTPNTTVTVSEQDSQTRTTPEKSLDSNTNIVNNNATIPTTSAKTSITQPPPAIVKPMVSSTQQQTAYASQAATIMITSTPMVQSVAGQTRQNIFNNAGGVRSAPASSSIPQRIVLPNAANKSSPTKAVSSTTKGPIKSTPIKPMQSKTIISKLPLPSNKPYVPSRQLKKSGTVQPQKQNNRNNNNENGIEVIDVDLDFDSPYSPGSSDFEDLFEPPMEASSNNKGSRQNNTNSTKNTKSPAKNNNTNQSAFDSLFGNSPVYKPSTINNKKSKSTAMKIPVKYDKKQRGSGKQVGVKLDEDSLKILDDLPSSAVELQVKNKFLKKLNRQERVVEEVKLVLKPHYNKKHITKEQYKDILRRSVPKICHNKSGEINPKKIQCLIDAYVRKARIANRKNSGGTGGVTNSGVNNNNAVQTNSSMPQTLPKPTKTTFWS